MYYTYVNILRVFTHKQRYEKNVKVLNQQAGESLFFSSILRFDM